MFSEIGGDKTQIQRCRDVYINTNWERADFMESHKLLFKVMLDSHLVPTLKLLPAVFIFFVPYAHPLPLCGFPATTKRALALIIWTYGWDGRENMRWGCKERGDALGNAKIITPQSPPCSPWADMNDTCLEHISVLRSVMHGLNIHSSWPTVLFDIQILEEEMDGGTREFHYQ